MGDITRQDFLPIAGLFAVATLTSCGSNSTGSTPGVPPPGPSPTPSPAALDPTPGQEGLTVDEAALVDAAPRHGPYDLSAIVLADGTTVAQVLASIGAAASVRRVRTGRIDGKKAGVAILAAAGSKTPEEYKRECLALLIQFATKLTVRSNFVHGDEGSNRPAQPNGLAYVYGSRDHTTRQTSKGCCTEILYGLDCSGLVFESANAGGLPLPASVTASSIMNPSTWNAVIPPAWKLTMKVVSDGSLQNGDIAATSKHCGILASDTGTWIVQSNGVPGCSASGGANTTECTKNFGSHRGPSAVALDFAVANIFKSQPAILRLVPNVTFTVELRWGPDSDLDLHVVEPDGTHVFYSNLHGVSGDLDFDNTVGFGPEHYTTHPDLKDGDYAIGVNYYRGTTPQTAKLVITAGDKTAHYSQVFSQGIGSAGDFTPTRIATVNVTTVSGQRTIKISP